MEKKIIYKNVLATAYDIIKHCYFYKGEVIVPEEYDGKNEGKLWLAEKFICEEIPHLIDRKNLRMSIRDYIESYVGKWGSLGNGINYENICQVRI